MSSRLITPSQLSLFSISPVIGAWWEELQAQKLFEGSKPAVSELFNEGRLETHQGNCANCITWRTACPRNNVQLYPGQKRMFEAVEHNCESVHSREPIGHHCRVTLKEVV